MAGISVDEIRKAARLANLKVADGELKVVSSCLSDVLGHIAMLDRLDTGNVPPMSHVLPVENVFRPDETTPTLESGNTLDNAPSQDKRYFSVPRIIAE